VTQNTDTTSVSVFVINCTWYFGESKQAFQYLSLLKYLRLKHSTTVRWVTCGKEHTRMCVSASSAQSAVDEACSQHFTATAIRYKHTTNMLVCVDEVIVAFLLQSIC